MIKNIFTSSLRNILRNPSFSLINLIGLSVSMSLGMLIILVVKEQNKFDNWNNYYGNYVYFKLQEGRSPQGAEKALDEINKKYYTGLKLETRDSQPRTQNTELRTVEERLFFR